MTNAPLLTTTSAAANNPAKTDPSAKGAVIIPKTIPEKQPVRSEIAVMGMIPDGDYRLFSATVRCNAWTVGVEYDRHSWGHFMKSQMDYVVEFIPVVVLSEPAESDFWGNAKSPNQQLVSRSVDFAVRLSLVVAQRQGHQALRGRQARGDSF